MASPVFPITKVNMKPNCTGFVNSKTKNKHFKAHCQGIPPGKFGSGDMKHKGFKSATEYEQAGCAFINGAVPSYQWQVVDRDGNIARWDSHTGEFAVQSSGNNCLLTYHIRTSEQFANAAFERAVHFYAEGTAKAWGDESKPGMSQVNEWVAEAETMEFETSDY